MLAEQFGAELRVLHVVQEAFFESVIAQHESVAQSAIEEQLAMRSDPISLNAKPHVTRGVDYEDIIGEAEAYGADLIVLGTHRHDNRELFQGTTIERIVRYGRTPVLMVKNPISGPYRSALAGVDLSDQAKAALKISVELVGDGVVHLIHVADGPLPEFFSRDAQNQSLERQRQNITLVIERWVQEISEPHGKASPRFDTILRKGSVAETIRSDAVTLQADLLAIGTHGRTGIARAFLGSVAEDLLAISPCDVLVVRR